MMMASSSKSEQAYIRSSLLANPPFRHDGRSLSDYRPIALETKVAPLANGSARVSIGGATLIGTGGSLAGTEVIAAVNLEVEDVSAAKREGKLGGRLSCTVSCSPAAYPQLTGNSLDGLQHDLTSLLHESLSHPSLRPTNLDILPGKRAWLAHLDLLVLSDAGNIYDALFLAAAAALRDTRVPRTRVIEYKAPASSTKTIDRLALQEDGDVDMMDPKQKSGLDTRPVKQASDFELADYWDEGEPLLCSGSWPLCVTMNLVPPIHYVDATTMEESATDLRIVLLFSIKDSALNLHGMRLFGTGETNAAIVRPLLRQGESYARILYNALNSKLGDDGRKSRLPKLRGS